MVFRAILQEIIDALPEAQAVLFMDHEGEPVEIICHMDEFASRLVAAEQASLAHHLATIHGVHGAGALKEYQLRMSGADILVRILPDDYYLVVILRGYSQMWRVRRVMAQGALKIEAEI